MEASLVGLLLLAIALAWLAAFVWSLVVILKTDSDVWQMAGMSQLTWVLVVVLMPVIGVALFVTIARPQLRAHSNLAGSVL